MASSRPKPVQEDAATPQVRVTSSMRVMLTGNVLCSISLEIDKLQNM